MKKLFAILLITVMLLVFASCEESEPNNNDYGDWDDGWDDHTETWEDIITEDIIVEDIIVEDIIVEDIIVEEIEIVP